MASNLAREIGCGSYGKVFAYPNTKKAVKLITVLPNDFLNLQSFVRELDVLRNSNEYIVEFFKTDFRYGSVELHMELMDSDLIKHIETRVFQPKQILTIMEDITHGLHFLHSHSITHRDMKPSNVLISYDGDTIRAKLCDFGLSRKFSNELHRGSDYMVTRWYRAPEVIDTTEAYGFAIDMWAFGCIIYEMCTRRPLFPLTEATDLEKAMLRLPEKLDRIVYPKVNEMATNLLIKDPKLRWDAKRCLAELTQAPSPVYTKAYYVGSKISNPNAQEWFNTLLAKYPSHKRAIMHGLMLFHSTSMTHYDYRCSVFVGYLLYESLNDDKHFLKFLWDIDPADIDCRHVARWHAKHCGGPHMLSHYEFSKDVDSVMEDMFKEERVNKKRKLNKII